MKYKKGLVFICLLICLFSVASVVAGDVNETTVAIEDQNDEIMTSNNQQNLETEFNNSSNYLMSSSSEKEVLGTGSYSDLRTKIFNAQAGSTITLNENYVFDSNASPVGISISKSLTIDGQGHTIDANNQGRIFSISGSVVLQNIIFKNAYYSGNGGAIYCESDKSLFISYCTFQNNFAKEGGAIFFAPSGGQIMECTFTNNSATEKGGAVYIAVDGSIENSEFRKNVADKGGAIYCNYANKIYNDEFIENNATYGGAVYYFGSKNGVGKNIFNKNFADYGKAVYWEGTFKGNELGKSTFDGNETNIYSFYDAKYKLKSNLISNTNNITLNDTLNISIEFDSGYDGTIWVELFSKKLNKTVFSSYKELINVNGLIEWAVPYLGCGDYILNATYSGGHLYKKGSFIFMVTVLGLESYFDFYVVNNIEWGTPVVLNHNITVGATGLINIYINNEYLDTISIGQEYIVKELGGPYSDITLFYLGDDIYRPCKDTERIFVNRVDPIPTIADIESGVLSNIIISFNNDTTGNIKVVFDGHTYTGSLINGSFSFNVSNLIYGIKSLKITYFGDSKYDSYSVTHNVEVILKPSEINLDVSNILYGDNLIIRPIVSGSLGKFDIYIDESYKTQINEGDSYTLSKPTLGKHEIKVNYIDNKYYSNNEYRVAFTVYKCYPIEIADTEILFNSDKKFQAKFYDEYGNILINKYVIFNINGENFSTITDSKGIAILDKDLEVGNYTIIVSNPIVNENKIIKLVVFSSIQSKDVIEFNNTDFDFSAKFFDENAKKLVNTPVIFRFNDIDKVITTNNEGIASLNFNLDIGIYDITLINTVTSENKTYKLFIKSSLTGKYTHDIDEKDIIISVLPSSGSGSVTVKLPGDATGTVTLSIGGKNYKFDVVNGVANVKMPDLDNGAYSYSITYSGDGKYSSFTKTGKVTVNKPVKTTLTLKKVKVKRSAKKLTIQATLKINGKAVKGKIIKFKFNKKNYKAKTNAKGVAKITVKKSVLKKLKKGKKVTYTATYGKVTKKVTVKVKK